MSEQQINEAEILAALHELIDPELGINVVDLGLVYSAEERDGDVNLVMTMTTPACSLHASISQAAKEAIRDCIPEVNNVRVEIVWEPPWNPKMMSDAAKRQLRWRD
jgi:metal-sulfur cluster biosynthetic enzyme